MCQLSSHILHQRPAPLRGSSGPRISPLLSLAPHQIQASVAMLNTTPPFDGKPAKLLSESPENGIPSVPPLAVPPALRRNSGAQQFKERFFLYVQFLDLRSEASFCCPCRIVGGGGGRAAGGGSMEFAADTTCSAASVRLPLFSLSMLLLSLSRFPD
uniref:Uncharacterized protein n=1 Tax=Oryza brachyantha TaxID=4533 RepID=J3MM38_ORYBR